MDYTGIGYAPRDFELNGGPSHLGCSTTPLRPGHFGPFHVHYDGSSHFGAACSMCPDDDDEVITHTDLPAHVHVDTDTVHGDVNIIRIPLPDADTLVLPRILPHPPSPDAGPHSDAILAVPDHSLTLLTGPDQIPTTFLHDMYRAIKNTRVMSTAILYTTIEATVTKVPFTEFPFPVYLPSIVLGVYSTEGTGEYDGQSGTIHPIHAAVLAGYCRNLPKLPIPAANPYGIEWHKCVQPTSDESVYFKYLRTLVVDCPPETSLMLPVVPLPLPHPPTFPILVSFMYNPSAPWLLNWLLNGLDRTAVNALSSASTPSEAMAASMVAYGWTACEPAHQLLTSIRDVEGIASNACALGITHREFWYAVDIAWGVLTRGIATRGEELEK